MEEYNPLATSFMTDGQMRYMPQTQYLTPTSYGAFRDTPLMAQQQPINQNPGYFKSLAMTNNNAYTSFFYSPVQNTARTRAQATNYISDVHSALGANIAGLIGSTLLTSGLMKIGGTMGLPGTLAALGLSMTLGNVADLYTDRQANARALQNLTRGKIVSGDQMDSAFGSGFSGYNSRRLDSFLYKQGIHDAVFDADDYRKMLGMGIQNGLFDYANNVEQYKKTLKNIRKNVTTIMEVTGSQDFKDIMKNLKRMQDMGATQGMYKRIMRNENMYARITGLSHEELVNTYGSMGALEFAQNGLSSIQGSQLGMHNAATVTLGMRNGTISAAYVAREGGVSGLTQSLNKESANAVMKYQDILRLAAYDPETGGIRKDFNLSGLDVTQLTQMANNTSSKIAQMGTSAWLNYNFKKADIDSALAEKFGGQEGITAAMAELVGRALDKNATRQEAMMKGLVMLGHTPEHAMLKVSQIKDMETQRENEKAYEAQKEYIEYKRQMAPLRRTMREFVAFFKEKIEDVVGGLVDSSMRSADLLARQKSGIDRFIGLTSTDTIAINNDIAYYTNKKARQTTGGLLLHTSIPGEDDLKKSKNLQLKTGNKHLDELLTSYENETDTDKKSALKSQINEVSTKIFEAEFTNKNEAFVASQKPIADALWGDAIMGSLMSEAMYNSGLGDMGKFIDYLTSNGYDAKKIRGKVSTKAGQIELLQKMSDLKKNTNNSSFANVDLDKMITNLKLGDAEKKVSESAKEVNKSTRNLPQDYYKWLNRDITSNSVITNTGKGSSLTSFGVENNISIAEQADIRRLSKLDPEEAKKISLNKFTALGEDVLSKIKYRGNGDSVTYTPNEFTNRINTDIFSIAHKYKDENFDPDKLEDILINDFGVPRQVAKNKDLQQAMLGALMSHVGSDSAFYKSFYTSANAGYQNLNETQAKMVREYKEEKSKLLDGVANNSRAREIVTGIQGKIKEASGAELEANTLAVETYALHKTLLDNSLNKEEKTKAIQKYAKTYGISEEKASEVLSSKDKADQWVQEYAEQNGLNIATTFSTRDAILKFDVNGKRFLKNYNESTGNKLAQISQKIQDIATFKFLSGNGLVSNFNDKGHFVDKNNKEITGTDFLEMAKNMNVSGEDKKALEQYISKAREVGNGHISFENMGLSSVLSIDYEGNVKKATTEKDSRLSDMATAYAMKQNPNLFAAQTAQNTKKTNDILEGIAKHMGVDVNTGQTQPPGVNVPGTQNNSNGAGTNPAMPKEPPKNKVVK